MNAALWSALISSATGVLVVLLTNRSTKKGADATNALSERVVDRDDFKTVVDELRESLTDVRSELAQVKAELAEEAAARKQAEHQAQVAAQRADEAERRATRLERRVSQLERVLREHDIPVPPVPTD